MTLDASLTLQQAGKPIWGTIVVGAGPAGAMAARELARRGVSVLLVDQASFPRYKVCGCCLNGRALAALSAIGMGNLATRSGAVPLLTIELACGGRAVRIPLEGSVALSREALDTALIREAVAAGAAFLPQTRAALGACGNADVRIVELHQGPARTQASARCVLAADGLGGKLLGRAGVAAAPPAPHSRIGVGAVAEQAPAYYRSGIVYMSCGAHGYLGLVRLEDGRLDAAAALDASWVRACGGPARAATSLLAEAGWPPIAGLGEAAWRGTPALTRRATRRAADRLFVLGDAAGYVEPFTGEGMAWALAGGLAVAPLAARASQRWTPELAAVWTAKFRHVVARRQFACHAAALVLRHPLLARIIIRLLTHLPGLAVPFLRHLNTAGPETGGPRPRLPFTNLKEISPFATTEPSP
jgi:flavin-dependent dehydrogenase